MYLALVVLLLPHNGPTATWLLGATPVHVLEQPSSTQGRPSLNPSKLCRSADERPLLALSAMHCKSFCFANCHTPQGCSENFAYQVNLLQILGYVVAFPVPAAISTATMLTRSASCHRSFLDLLRRLNMQLLCCGPQVVIFVAPGTQESDCALIVSMLAGVSRPRNLKGGTACLTLHLIYCRLIVAKAYTYVRSWLVNATRALPLSTLCIVCRCTNHTTTTKRHSQGPLLEPPRREVPKVDLGNAT